MPKQFSFVIAAFLFLAVASCASVAVRPPKIPESPAGFVTARDGKLWLDGQRYRFLGVNTYSLASQRGKYVCGMPHTDEGVRQLLDEVAAMGCNAIRINVFQSFTAGAEDFSRFDFILDQAYARGIRVIMTLENQWKDCTEGGYKDSEWYKHGYRQPDGTFRLSYRDYAQLVVSRYRSHPGVLMWQLMNESESAIDQYLDDPEPMLGFVDDMSRLVSAIDPDHLLSFGTSGITHLGTGSAFFPLAHQLPCVDIVEAHDYNDEASALPADIRIPILVAKHLRKPFFIGESGMDMADVEPPRRAKYIEEKMEAAWQMHVDGYVLWSYRAWDCTGLDFCQDDPLVVTLRDFSKKHGIRPAPL